MSRPFKRLLTSTCMSAAIMTIAVGNAYANPQDGVVSAGAATITSSGNKLDIHQSTQKAIIDWRSFDIGATETTQFYQPSSSSITLNRVNSSTPSFIDGHLIANGNIFIVNQNGVVFGQNSRVDVNGLVASTANISDANFMAGNFRFDQAGNSTATIENRGQITAGEAGLIGLVAPNVLNSGVIHAKLGRVHLASGDRATVDLYGDGLIEVAADDYAQQRVVKNTGKIIAEGGTIAMTAAAGSTMVNSLIRVSGELHAPSVGVKNGRIIIGAEGSNAVVGNVKANKGKKSGSSEVIIDGVLDVSGKNTGEKGGSIAITADHIEVLANALIDATGSAGGGRISIGGASNGTLDSSGVLPVIDQAAPVALTTTIDQGALIDASAIESGDGGSVTIYSDKVTKIDGDIRATGAGESGNGGFADTSGHDALIVNGTVTLSGGRRGRKGEWLLDPADITITGPDTNISGGPNYTPTGTGSQVSAATIVSNLNAGTNVTIMTANDAYAGNGDIFVNSAITTTGSGSLTLSAFRNIVVSSAITLNGGSLTLRSDNTGIGSGAINVAAAIATTGGNITMGGGSGTITAGNGFATGNGTQITGITTSANISAGGGNIIMNGRGSNATGDRNDGISITGGTISTTGNGTIVMTGVGRGTGNSKWNVGVNIYGGSTVQTANGNITINGTGGGAGTGFDNFGVAVSNGSTVVRATGTASVSITGTGGNSAGTGTTNHGVYITTGATGVRTASGNITVTGMGSSSSGGTNHGIITGFLGTTGGNITLNGTGGASTGSSNYGVALYATLGLSSAGTLNVTGTGGGSGASGSNYGVYVSSTASLSTVNGNLTLTGTGGSGSGADNIGIRGDAATTVQTTGTGNLIMTGTTNGSGANAKGIYLNGGGVYRTTGSGNITLSGTGGSGNAYNVGIQLAATVASQGSGSLTVSGTGGSGSTASNSSGILLQSGGLQTATGALNVTATGGTGSGSANSGLQISSAEGSLANVVQSTGTGTITIRAVKGGGTSGYGVYSDVTNSIISTTSGNITVFTDTISLGASNAINAAGALNIATYTNGMLGVGYTTGHTLNLDDTSLSNMTGASYIFGSLLTGTGSANGNNVVVRTTRDFGAADVTFISGNDIVLNGTLSKATGTGTSTYTFKAYETIRNTSNAGISSTSGLINLIWQSDFDGNQSGAIFFNGGSILTNGGNITMGGGSGTISASNGYAYGTASYRNGVTLNGSLIAAGGNIIINGTSQLSSADLAHGVQNTALVSTAGIGTVYIDGISRGTSNANTGYGIYAQSGITSVNGNITLVGAGGGAGTGANSYGIVFSSAGGYARATGTGSISATGTGGQGTGGAHYGIFINVANAVQTAIGNITLVGNGGNGGGANSGIVIGSGGTTGGVTSAGGVITITGTGGASFGSSISGIRLIAGSVTNTGSGSITINGTGGGTGANAGNNSGVFIDTGSTVSTVNGALNINGTGSGIGSTGPNYGVIIGNAGNSIIQTTGTGAITINGTGGNGSGSSINNQGVVLNAGNTIQSTSTGTITLIGTGSASSGGSGVGINILGTVSGVGGAILLTGNGGLSSANSNDGIRISAGSVTNIGSGTITLNGTGGGSGSSGSNVGVWILNGGVVSTVNGALDVTGTGGASTGGLNHGINVSSTSSTIKTTGSGTVTLTGITPSSSSNGIVVSGIANGVQTTGTGNIRLYTNALSLNTASSVNSIGSLNIASLTGVTMGVGTGAGTFSLTDALLSYTAANSYILGRTASGNVTINSGFDFADKNVSFISGGNIVLAGTLTKASGTGTANYLFQANGNITNSGNAGVASPSGAVNINFVSDYDVSGAGNIALSGAGLLSNNGIITLTSNGQTVNLSGTIGGATTINSGNGAVTLGSIDGTTVGTKDLNVNAGTATFTTTAAIGATNKLRNITVNADDVVLGANLAGSGILTLQPTTLNKAVRVNYGTGDFNLSSTELGYLVDGWSQINIGNIGTTVDIYIGSSTWTDPVVFRSDTRKYIYDLTGTGNASFGATGGFIDLYGNITTAGGAVDFSGLGSYLFATNGDRIISTNGGNVLLKDLNINTSGSNLTVNSSGGNITVTRQIVHSIGGNGRTITLNAGSGSVAFNNTVNTQADIVATGATITASGTWGNTTSLGNVTLTSVNSISLPSITTAAGKTVSISVSGAGNNITTTGAIATGTGGNILLTADDLVLGGNLSGTGTLTLQPYSNTRVIRIAGSAGDFNLSNAELAYLVNGWNLINIGRTDSNMRNWIAQNNAITFQDNVVIRQTQGQNYQAINMTDGASFTVTGNMDFYADVVTNGGNINVNGYIYGGGASFITNGGSVTSLQLRTWDANVGHTINTSGGNITLTNGILQAGTPSGAKTFVLNAGTGTVNMGGVNTWGDVSVTGGTITLNAAWGNTIALGNVTLNSANSISLPAITTVAGKTVNVTVTNSAGTITTTGAIATGAGGNITFTADDVAIGSSLSGTGDITLQPYDNARSVKINRGASNGSSFHLSAAEIANLADGWGRIFIGKATGATNYTDIDVSTFIDPVYFRGWYTRIYGEVAGTGNASLNFMGTSNEINMNGPAITTQGQSIYFQNTASSYQNLGTPVINSNGGSITFNSLIQIMATNFGTLSILSGGGNITLASGNSIIQGNLTSGGFNIDAGTGTLTVAAINTSGYVTINAATINTSSAWGASRALGNVNITSANSLTLRAITTAAGNTVNATVTGAGNVLTTTGAITVGAAGNISLTADDLVLGGALNGTGTLTLQPNSASRILRVNHTGGDFNLSTADIAFITNGWNLINIGRTDATISSYIGTSTWNDPVHFRNGYGQLIFGTITTTDNAGLTFSSAPYGTNFISGGNISSDGAITFNSYVWQSAAASITTTNDNITFANSINIGPPLAVNAGTGNVSILGNVSRSGSAGSSDLNITANSISFGGTIGSGAYVLDNVTLNTVGSLTLTNVFAKNLVATVSGTGNSITTNAITTGASGNITLTADDLIIGGNLSGTGTVILRPYSNGTVTRVNYGAGDFNLSATEIANLVNGWGNITIGRDTGLTNGAMHIGASNWLDPVLFTNGSGQTIYGAIIGSDNSSVRMSQTGGSSITQFNSGSSVNANAGALFDRTVSGYVDARSANANVTFNAIATDINFLTAEAVNGTVTLNGIRDASGAININANSIQFNGQDMGSSGYALQNVNLNSVMGMVLPTFRANTIFAQTAGAISDITINTGKSLTASGAGNAITLVAGRNFVNNSGSATPLNLTGSGRWLTYSTNPTDDTAGGISSDFVRYGCIFGGSCSTGVTIPGTGNGSIYIYRPTLTLTPTALPALTYGDAAPNLTGYSYDVSGYLTGTAGNDSANDVLSGSLNGTTTYTNLSNVGTYGVNYASGSVASALGYQFVYADNANAITINKKTLTVTANNQNVTYGTSVPAGSVTYTGFVNGETISVLDTLATLNSANSGILNAGTYVNNYTVSGGSDNNYSMNYVSGDLTVNKKTLNVTADTTTITYGDAIPSSTTISYNGFIAGEDETDLLSAPLTVSALSGLQNAGTYNNNYTLSGGLSNNYAFNYINGDLIIAKKDLAVSADNKSISYGSAVPTGSLTYSGFITGQNETFLNTQPTVSSTHSGILNAGTYAGNYIASGGVDNNYNLIYSSGTLTVTRIGVNVIVNNRSVIYGTSVPSTTLTYSGFVNGDDASDLLTQATITSGVTGIVNAGSYIGNYTASGATSNNYDFNYIAGDLTVNKKLLNVTANNRTVTYGDAIPSTALVYTGFITGEDVSFLNTAPIVTSLQSGVVNVGTYTGNYVPSGGVSNNYSFNYVSGNLNVVKKNLIISANSISIPYGTVTPGTTTLVYNGFVNGENESVLDTAPTAVSALSGVQNPGTYAGNYTVGGAADNNYSFTYVAGDLVIGGTIITPPTPPVVTVPLPNTYIYTFQSPEVSTLSALQTIQPISVSYGIETNSLTNMGEVMIGISPELANIFEITSEDIQNLNISQTIH